MKKDEIFAFIAIIILFATVIWIFWNPLHADARTISYRPQNYSTKTLTRQIRQYNGYYYYNNTTITINCKNKTKEEQKKLHCQPK